MITKNDMILLLTELQGNGVEGVDEMLTKLITKNNVTLDVLKFINNNRQLDVAAFYERLRANYNKKKSSLYINIVKEVEEPQEVLTTLSAMLTQILLYSKQLDNKQLFLAHSRAYDISRVLSNYFKTYDITNALNLMKLIKADLKALESIK